MLEVESGWEEELRWNSSNLKAVKSHQTNGGIVRGIRGVGTCAYIHRSGNASQKLWLKCIHHFHICLRRRFHWVEMWRRWCFCVETPSNINKMPVSMFVSLFEVTPALRCHWIRFLYTCCVYILQIFFKKTWFKLSPAGKLNLQPAAPCVNTQMNRREEEMLFKWIHLQMHYSCSSGEALKYIFTCCYV